MFSGPPLPLPPDLPIGLLLAQVESTGLLGAWVRGCAPRLRLYRIPDPGCQALASSDLGFLLAHCSRVVVREGDRPVVVGADTLIRWRALQVATGTPYLPGLDRLRALFPGLQSHANDLLIPLRAHSPEEVLARCLDQGVQVAGSRVVYVAGGGEGREGRERRERRERREGRERRERRERREGP